MRSEEILKCICFVILGYFIALIFNRMCSCRNINGFNVGGVVQCETCNDQGNCDNGLDCRRTDSDNLNTICGVQLNPNASYCLPAPSTDVRGGGDSGDQTDVEGDVSDEDDPSYGGVAGQTMGPTFPQNFLQVPAQAPV